MKFRLRIFQSSRAFVGLGLVFGAISLLSSDLAQAQPHVLERDEVYGRLNRSPLAGPRLATTCQLLDCQPPPYDVLNGAIFECIVNRPYWDTTPQIVTIADQFFVGCEYDYMTARLTCRGQEGPISCKIEY